jgi:hypothetical protein
MNDQDHFKLLFGPYEPPKIQRDQWIFCEMRGLLKVGTWSNGPIPWPQRYRTGSIILCGDLVRAVKLESVEAVCHHWGVCRNVVQKWRHALGVKGFTPGTRQLQKEVHHNADSPARKRAEARANQPTAILSRGKLAHERAHPLVRPASSELVRERMARTRRHINPALRLWSDEEEKLLGTARDEDVARQINRSKAAVQARRNFLGIPALNYLYSRPWTEEEDLLLGVVPDRVLAKRLNRTFLAVQARRSNKRIPPVAPLQRRFTKEEDAVISAMSDSEAAQKLGRSVDAVASRRRYIRAGAKQPDRVVWD